MRMAPACLTLATLCVWIAPAELERAVRILSPLNECILDSGRFDIVASVGGFTAEEAAALAVTVDGRRAERVPTRPPTVLARVELEPGEHTITVGTQVARVFVKGDDDLPESVREWPVAFAHPGGADGRQDCAACHVTSEEDGALAIRDLVLPDACLTCHPPADFELAHSHPLTPIAGCRRCHATHGAVAAKLLRAPAKRLCAECHE